MPRRLTEEEKKARPDLYILNPATGRYRLRTRLREVVQEEEKKASPRRRSRSPQTRRKKKSPQRRRSKSPVVERKSPQRRRSKSPTVERKSPQRKKRPSPFRNLQRYQPNAFEHVFPYDYVGVFGVAPDGMEYVQQGDILSLRPIQHQHHIGPVPVIHRPNQPPQDRGPRHPTDVSSGKAPKDSPAKGDDQECIACTTKKAVMMYECGHVPYCHTCSQKVENNKCPMCRQVSKTMCHIRKLNAEFSKKKRL